MKSKYLNKAAGESRRVSRGVPCLLIVLIIGVWGCKPKYPGDIMRPEEIKPVLFDVMVATQVMQLDTAKQTKAHLRDSITLAIRRVLETHQVDDSLYFRSMAYYEAHPDELKILLDSTRAYGSRLQDTLRKLEMKAEDSVKALRPAPKERRDSLKPTEARSDSPVVKAHAAVPVGADKKTTEKR